jgi:hypothetical protein
MLGIITHLFVCFVFQQVVVMRDIVATNSIISHLNKKEKEKGECSSCDETIEHNET